MLKNAPTKQEMAQILHKKQKMTQHAQPQ